MAAKFSLESMGSLELLYEVSVVCLHQRFFVMIVGNVNAEQYFF